MAVPALAANANLPALAVGDADILALANDMFSPAMQTGIVAAAARAALEEATGAEARVLGRAPPYDVVVDGRRGASEDDVKPSGTIVYEFHVLGDVFSYIAAELRKHAPVGSGKDPHSGQYRDAFTFFIDEKESDPNGAIPAGAAEYVFVNFTPYARKIERGLSPQAPDGVFEAVALLARSKFDNVARFEFTYRGLIGRSSGAGTLVKAPGRPRGAHNRSDVRYPCIVVTPR